MFFAALGSVLMTLFTVFWEVYGLNLCHALGIEKTSLAAAAIAYFWLGGIFFYFWGKMVKEFEEISKRKRDVNAE